MLLADDLRPLLSDRPDLLALGEPTHGIEAFPLLRNELLTRLVGEGFRSVALETDRGAAAAVDAYAAGGDGDLDTVLATGFTHGFGRLPANRALVEWLRAHNAGAAPDERVHFHGFDAPLEYSGAPSPRAALAAAHDGPLPDDVDTLLGPDADWTNPAAMYDPAASVGRSDRARALRAVAERCGARDALDLLRYHEAMATPGPDRVPTLLGLRAEMMAANLLAIRERERDRGPTLAFAHNAHLQRAAARMPTDDGEVRWANAGALVARELGHRYRVVLTDTARDPAPGTLQAALARSGAALTGADRVPDLPAGDPVVRGHIPLTAEAAAGADAVLYLADADLTRIEYW